MKLWWANGISQLGTQVSILALPLAALLILGRALAMASIPVAYWLGDLTMLHLYVVAAVVGALSVTFDVSYLSFLPGLVERERLGEANSKLPRNAVGRDARGPDTGGRADRCIRRSGCGAAVSRLSTVAFAFLLAKPIRSIATVDGDARAPRDGGLAAPAG